MIKEYVSDIASQMGIMLTKVSLVDGQPVGCSDACIISISVRGHSVDALVYVAEIVNLENGVSCDRLEQRVRSALSRLQILLEP